MSARFRFIHVTPPDRPCWISPFSEASFLTIHGTKVNQLDGYKGVFSMQPRQAEMSPSPCTVVALANFKPTDNAAQGKKSYLKIDKFLSGLRSTAVRQTLRPLVGELQWKMDKTNL